MSARDHKVDEEQGQPKSKDETMEQTTHTNGANGVSSGTNGAKRRPAKTGQPVAAPSERPEIKITADMHVMVEQAIGAMRRDLSLYQRNNTLVHVVQSEDDSEDGRQQWTPGTPVIREAHNLTERLTRFSYWLGFDGRREEWVHKLPPERVVREVQRRRIWPGVREIIGVIETPSIDPEGNLISVPGFNAATRFEYRPNMDYRLDLLSVNATRDEARAALEELLEVFADFPYTEESHRYVPIAAILTMIGRPAIRGACPGFLFDAPTPGSGKSKQTDAVSIIATGRHAARRNYPIQEEELEKVMGSYALGGASLINFDNVEVPFDSATLNMYFTSPDTVSPRVLGVSECPTVPWRAVILASGCNMQVYGHCTRRVMVARIQPTEETPEDRTSFRHPDLEGYCKDQRARLVRAALTILRAYVCAGRPTPLRWGGFESWSALIPSAIVYAGGIDPMTARPPTRGPGADPEKEAMAVLMQEWHRLDPSSVGITAKAIITRLFTLDRIRGCGPDGDPLPPQPGLDEMREAIECLVPTKAGLQPNAKLFGDKLRRWRDRPVGGVRFVKRGESGGTTRWGVDRVEDPAEDFDRS